MAPTDRVQAELDARWAWAELRRHEPTLRSWLQTPPTTLTASEKSLVAILARLSLQGMWEGAETGDLHRLRGAPRDLEAIVADLVDLLDVLGASARNDVIHKISSSSIGPHAGRESRSSPDVSETA